ncbi:MULTISPECIES: flagellar motor protein MotD [unclassified Thioalkalivibrio]|uniref:flagellar motor protein MotD n=1 Tax=unclassified Thioalkalivibrio TaxID=2621013 RepID=UPI00036786F3|nr:MULTISPECIES: flagellar motor protein MotD [unclassified Thioalkalivibrio]PYG04060.1 chemotaxis protein MotB [Thioalkalivibrio sp. ALE21]
MARRKHQEEEANHEAWAIPYGDLVTLLLAFFVVMYAISSVDEGKYRVLSDSLVEAFGTPGQLEPIQVGDPGVVAPPSDADVPRSLAPIDIRPGLLDEGPQALDRAASGLFEERGDEDLQGLLDEIAEVAAEIESAMAPMIEDGQVDVTRDTYWLEIEITSQLLFPSGEATLNPDAEPVLEDIAGVLAPRAARIHVEGHTDNVPITTAVYPSNWELSAARAATVVRMFEQQGMDPADMVALGHGEYRPVADNETAAGRAENRRVAIVVLPGAPPREDGQREPEQLRDELPSP